MNKQALLDELTAQFHKLGNVAPVELSPAEEGQVGAGRGGV